MRKVVMGAVLALALSSAVLGTGPAVASHGSCHTSGTPLAAGTAATGSVASGQAKVYKVVVPPGEAGDVAVWGVGDVDLYVCTPGGTVYCKSDLIAGSPDACNIGGWDLDGKTLNPGTYYAEVRNCFDAGCGYVAGLPPVNFVIAFATA